MKVLIMRGLPGSGKTTWHETHPQARQMFVCSADHYHVDPDGVYRFKPEKAREAHNECLRRFALAVVSNCIGLIVVDNTNLSAWEVSPYYRTAEAFGADVEIVHCLCSPETSKSRNVHGLPPEKIDQMAARVDALPPWWNLTTVQTERAA